MVPMMNNIAAMMGSGFRAVGRYVLAGCVLISLLCAPALVAQAATIETLQLLSDEAGESLRIGMDEAAEYQVFNLTAPDRLVVSFPNAKMAALVTAMPGAGSIENIVPAQDSHGVRIEIALLAGTQYEIVEKGNDLLVKFTAQAAPSTGESGALLQDIEVRDRNGVTELVLRGQHMDANHNALVSNDGATMVLDFWHGKSSLPKEYYAYSAQRLNHVAIGSAEGRMRLVVALRGDAGAHHQIDASASEMIIRFGKIKAKKHAGALIVEAVDFQPDDRIAHLVIRTNGSSPIVNLQEKDGKVIIDLKQAQLADGQERSQDVRAFPGPVKQIDSYTLNKDVRIVARLRQKSIVTSYQTGNVLTVTLKPADMVAARQADDEVVRDERIYNGQKVTFNYKDIDIRNALKLIAEMSELNIIMSDDVTGVLTMRLVDVPWDQALDIILSAKGLGKEKNGNVVRIAPLAVLKADSDARKDAKKSAEQIAPLETEFIQLGYASVNDVRTILEGGSVKKNIAGTAVVDAGGANGQSAASAASSQSSGELKLLSDRGIIMLDERSNTMIITDTRERLNNIKRLIAVIDKPAQQVLIEARIVEASDSFSRDLGVKWGGGFRATGNRFAHGIGSPGNPVGAVGTNIVDLGAAAGAG
ncbi:MAG: AMIN domain-containing protein, partial [Mariprofundus sp.]|nr:AMIN domain-containing protein [Mariprofundus sp.]